MTPSIITFCMTCLITCNVYAGFVESQEQKEVKTFRQAYHGFLEANRYLKKITSQPAETSASGVELGSVSKKESNTYIKMLADTLNQANSVSDAVLAKIHPELPKAYRSIFIASLENKLHGWRDSDPEASLKGTLLHNQWIDWWNAHYKKFAKL